MAAACSSEKDLIDPPDPAREEIAEVTLALTMTPVNVRCISITAFTTTASTRQFDVMANDPTVWKLSLPVGVVVFTAAAYNEACATVTPMSTVSWLGGPLTVTLHPGANMVTLNMRPIGTASVAVDFDPALAPTCAPVGSACTADANCCTGNVCTMGAPELPAGVGRCQAAAPPPRGVNLNLNASSNYILYPLGGAADCRPTSGPPYLVTLGPGERMCIDPALGEVIAMRMGPISRCTATEDGGTGICPSCASGDASCQPAGCFAQLPKVLAAPDACPGRLMLGLIGATHYLIIPRAAANGTDAPGMPRVAATNSNMETLRVNVPPGHDGFAHARFTQRVNGEGVSGDSCGATNLCGLVDFTGGGFFSGWSFFGPWSTASIFR